jgi:iron complex transport system ATP-binding protein
MIQIQNFSYEIQHKKLFKQVNTTFERQKIHTIYGDNGIGKTTFFQILSGIIRAYEGQIHIQNQDIKTLNALQLSDLISICYASQPQSDIFVHEVFSFSQIHENERNEIAKLFGIMDFMDRNIQALSEGERQWIFLARAMARKASILLLDEPTAFLDLSKRKKLKEILINASQSRTILINTHDEDLSKISNNIIWNIDNQNFNQVKNLN